MIKRNKCVQINLDIMSPEALFIKQMITAGLETSRRERATPS